jgi:hypothetical protein
MFSHGKSDALVEVIGRDNGKDRGDRSSDVIDSFGRGPHNFLANSVGDVDRMDSSRNAKCPKQDEQHCEACKYPKEFAAQ